MKKILVIMVLALVMVWGIGVKGANATYWVTTDGNTNYLNFPGYNNISGNEIFAMFDSTVDISSFSGTSGGYLAILPSTSSSVQVDFSVSGGIWTASNITDGGSIALGSSGVFQVGFFDGSAWSIDTSISGSYGQYTVNFGTEFVIQTDATPVPIPAALWLFGSGLLGMFGIRRRFKNHTEYDEENRS